MMRLASAMLPMLDRELVQVMQAKIVAVKLVKPSAVAVATVMATIPRQNAPPDCHRLTKEVPVLPAVAPS